MSVFDLIQFSEFLILNLIDIVDMVAVISCLRAEEDHEDQLDNRENLEHVEEPVPAKCGGDLAGDDRRQTGRRVEDEGDESNAEPTLMDEEHISDSGND